MTPKPVIWKSRIVGLWMVDPPSSHINGNTEAFRTWQEALAYALELARKFTQEPPC